MLNKTTRNIGNKPAEIVQPNDKSINVNKEQLESIYSDLLSRKSCLEKIVKGGNAPANIVELNESVTNLLAELDEIRFNPELDDFAEEIG